MWNHHFIKEIATPMTLFIVNKMWGLDAKILRIVFAFLFLWYVWFPTSVTK